MYKPSSLCLLFKEYLVPTEKQDRCSNRRNKCWHNTAIQNMLQAIYSKVSTLLEEKNDLRLLDLMAGILIAIAVVVHLIIVKGIEVPYGRFSSGSWGPPINARLAWFLQESPSLILPLYIAITREVQFSSASTILLSMFIIHYFNRVTIYPFRIRGGKPTPAFVALLAFLFCSYNGYMQSLYLLKYAKYPHDWIYQPNFIIGVFIFVWGMHTNIACDDILRNLRKPGESGYKIPQGSMFEFVSCANLFAESVEWLGFAIASCSLQAAAFAIFAVLFLSARSYNHHNWYLKKFDNYPKGRKIFIPYII